MTEKPARMSLSARVGGDDAADAAGVRRAHGEADHDAQQQDEGEGEVAPQQAHFA